MTDTATPRNREAERRTAQLLRAAVLAWYSPAWPPACACCDTADQLGIDHVNGDGPAQRAAAWGHPGRTGYNPAQLYRWLIGHGFPEGFQVMCLPCNSSKGSGPACRLYHGQLGEHQKWCTGCLRIRDKRADFHKHPRTRDGLNAQCKDCGRRAQEAWRQRNPDVGRQVSTRPGSVGGRILAHLAQCGTQTTGEIATALGISAQRASAALGGLLSKGHVERLAPGLYCLPGQDSRQARRRVYRPGPEGRAAMNGHDWAAGTTWTTVPEVTEVI